MIDFKDAGGFLTPTTELDNYSDGELLDWLFDLAGVTTVVELEDILINHSKQEAGTFTCQIVRSKP